MRVRRVHEFRSKQAKQRVSENGEISVCEGKGFIRVEFRVGQRDRFMGACLLYQLWVCAEFSEADSVSEGSEGGWGWWLGSGPGVRVEEDGGF
jgi:hypothetical protein